jgi:hypothetical protein
LVPRINSQNINVNSAIVPGSNISVSTVPFGMRKCTITDINPDMVSITNRIPNTFGINPDLYIRTSSAAVLTLITLI